MIVCILLLLRIIARVLRSNHFVWHAPLDFPLVVSLVRNLHDRSAKFVFDDIETELPLDMRHQLWQIQVLEAPLFCEALICYLPDTYMPSFRLVWKELANSDEKQPGGGNLSLGGARGSIYPPRQWLDSTVEAKSVNTTNQTPGFQDKEKRSFELFEYNSYLVGHPTTISKSGWAHVMWLIATCAYFYCALFP